MKVLLINGSPHKEGCTYTALREVADTLEAEGIETEIVWIGTKPVAGCIACGTCRETGKCVFDDVVNETIAKLPEAHGIVVGSPVYYGGPSGQIHAFLDRLFYAGSGFAGKVGAAVMSCRRGGASATFDVLNKYFGMNNMPIATSQYWNQVHGNTPDQVRQDEEGLQTMRTLARNMAWMLKCIEAGRAAGIEYPQHEAPIKTNFIR